MRNLDLFRFGAHANPSTPGEFTSFPRDLRPNVPAYFDDLSNEWSFSTGAFTGDGRQASHWKDDSLTGVNIGLMDPTLSPGVIMQISEADVRSLDVIGWDFEEPAAGARAGLAPAAGSRPERTRPHPPSPAHVDEGRAPPADVIRWEDAGEGGISMASGRARDGAAWHEPAPAMRPRLNRSSQFGPLRRRVARLTGSSGPSSSPWTRTVRAGATANSAKCSGASTSSTTRRYIRRTSGASPSAQAGRGREGSPRRSAARRRTSDGRWTLRATRWRTVAPYGR